MSISTGSQLIGFNNFFKAIITRKTSIKEVTKLCCALDLNITIFQAGSLSAWRPGGVSAWRLVLRRLVHRRDVPWRGVLWRQRP